MRSLFVVFLCCVVVNKVKGYDYIKKNQTINMLTKYASNFLVYSEYSAMADYIVGCVYDQTSWSTMIVGAAAKFATVSASKSGQAVLAYTKYTTVNILSGGSTTVSNAAGAVSANLQPFYAQCQGYVAKKQAKGMNETGCYNNVYRLATQFFTKNRIQLIMQRTKTKVTASKWTGLISSSYFGPFFNFDDYTLS